MKKKVLIVSVCIILFIIIIVIVGININTRNKKLAKDMEVIENTYKDIEVNIESYNSNREFLIDKFDGYYTDNLKDDYDDFILLFDKQYKIINDIKRYADKLDTLCGDRLYSKGDINKICNNYKDYYEIVNSLFEDDCNEVNKIIAEYNGNNDDKLDEYQKKS